MTYLIVSYCPLLCLAYSTPAIDADVAFPKVICPNRRYDYQHQFPRLLLVAAIFWTFCWSPSRCRLNTPARCAGNLFRHHDLISELYELLWGKSFGQSVVDHFVSGTILNFYCPIQNLITGVMEKHFYVLCSLGGLFVTYQGNCELIVLVYHHWSVLHRLQELHQHP